MEDGPDRPRGAIYRETRRIQGKQIVNNGLAGSLVLRPAIAGISTRITRWSELSPVTATASASPTMS